MRLTVSAVLFLAMLSLTAARAQESYFEPERGSQLREDLMDAIRPIAEWRLGEPVEFVVQDLRVSGNVGFAMLAPQRPGGGEIRLKDTPLVNFMGADPNGMDGTAMQVLYQQSGRMWVPVDYAIGATDAWWDWDIYCPLFRRVIPEVCRFE
jgi:hypothetical protein